MRWLALFSLGIVLSAPSAHAWYKHVYLMPGILEGLSEATNAKLETKIHTETANTEIYYAKLAQDLKLNPTAEIKPYPMATTVREALRTDMVDEPDGGMDRDLELSVLQEYMGGKTGPSSQGFRHMRFGGWKITAPLATLQFPPFPMGDAPWRARYLTERARDMFRGGDALWGARVLSWALHFVQDLAQPFHAVQLPSFSMIVWSSFLRGSFGDSNRAITNYHWAYEGYVLNRLEIGEGNVFEDCLRNSETQATYKGVKEEPFDIALGVAAASVSLGWPLGSDCVNFFGTALKSPDCELPKAKCMPNYETLISRSDIAGVRLDMERITCISLANAARASRQVIEWVLK